MEKATGGPSQAVASGLEHVLQILRDTYPEAQRAFLDLEVYENLMSRELIKKFAHVFELLSDTLCNGSDQTGEARLLLERIALDSLQYLCDERLKEIDRLDRRSWWFWTLLLMRNPFRNPEVAASCDASVDQYELGINSSQPFPARVAALRQCFEAMEQALAKIQPHQIYDRVFAIALRLLFVLAGFMVGTLWVARLIKE